MRYTLTITESTHAALADAIFSIAGKEGAAYLVCGVSAADGEVRLLGRHVIPVADHHYLVREGDGLSIMSDSYVAVAKRAREHREAVLFAHSHPPQFPSFSPQDDAQDPRLMAFLASRAPDLPHGCLVFSSKEVHRGRLWLGGDWQPITRMRVLGRRFRFADADGDQEPLPEFYDRQVRAFGPEIQRLLRRLHVGVVGAGGTGSAVIEELSRLGVGTISLFDGDHFSASNVNRVYGSSVFDAGREKVLLQADYVHGMGLRTELRTIAQHITEERAARELRDCDIIFGCTDRAAPRGILVRVALRYLIPVIDMGVTIESKAGTIEGVYGRVTTLLPGEACLFCRGRTDPDRIRQESLPPGQREREVAEGYAKELATDQPAVIMFTTAVAAQAVTEMIHRLTGFMGEARQSSEVLLLLHKSRVQTNRTPPDAGCACMRHEHWGRGDTKNFLGKTWPAAPAA